MSARYLYALPLHWETHDDDNGDGDDDDGTTRATPPSKILELRAGLVEGGVAGSRAGRWAPHL